MRQYYSYLWLRDDTSPYYVGKGVGRRAFISHGRISPPKDHSRILIFLHSSEAEAFASEIAFIEWFGRKDLGVGCLRNLTDGGEGFTRQHLEKTKTKISQTMKGRAPVVALQSAHSPEAEKKRYTTRHQTPSPRGWHFSAATSEKRSMRLTGVPRLPAVHKKVWDTRFLKTVAWG